MSLSNAAIFAESLGRRSIGDRPGKWHPITKPMYPLLFEAMDAVTHDSGGGCHRHYNIPPGWIETLPRIETVLGRLSPEQRETIAIGECSEQETLVREFEGLDIAHRFLNAFFEDFIECESIGSTPTTIAASVCYREGQITNADYNEAIEDLLRAKRQSECRHMCCSICEDTGHTAEMCHHNPLILARRWAAATKIWCCYHCGFVATNDEEAREHFGKDDLEPAKCQRGDEEGVDNANTG